jgi:hypothetical protein
MHVELQDDEGQSFAASTGRVSLPLPFVTARRAG